MPILNSEHLLEQSARLVISSPAGTRRQADLRRAISAAYYGVFHAVLVAVADQVVGVTKRATREYALVYRSVDHRGLRELCADIARQTLPGKYKDFAPSDGFSLALQLFAGAVSELQEKRHAADYDPLLRVNSADALVAIETARRALAGFAGISQDERKTFLLLLLFRPR